jgi:FG-GAP repeat
MNRDIQLSTPAVRELLFQVPVNKGGTGARTLSEAAANLGAIPQASMGVPGGVVKLDSSGKIPQGNLPLSAVVGPTLSGPTRCGINARVTWKITNYDPETIYVASTTLGYVSVAGDSVIFEAPAAIGTATITIGGRSFNLPIVDSIPDTPVVAAVGTGNSSLASVVITTTAFAEVGGTHKSTDWQISRNVDFSNLAASSLDDTINLLNWTSTAVELGATFYVRARHRDTANRVSDWSTVVEVVTSSSYVPGIETAILTAFDKVANDSFGRSVAISGDGTRIVVGAYGVTVSSVASAGAAYVFVLSNGAWVLEQKILMPNPTTGDNFGLVCSMDATGSRMAISAASTDTGGNVDSGAVYIYTRASSVWTLEQRLLIAGGATSSFFGSLLDLTPDGTRLIVGSFGTTTYTGTAYVYLRTGTVWALEATLNPGDLPTNSYYGCSVTLDDAGQRCAVGAYNSTTGFAYVYLRTGTTWALEQKISGLVSGSAFGWQTVLSSDGTRLAVSVRNAASGAATNAGAVEIWLRTGTVWAREATVMASDGKTDDLFSYQIRMNATASLLFVSTYRGDTSSLADTGSAYVFSRNGSNWTQLKKYTASNAASGDAFGVGMDISVDGSTLVVSAHLADPNAVSAAGAAYVYSGTATFSPFKEQAKLLMNDGAAGNSFSQCISLSADGTRALIGNWKQANGGFTQTGSAYFFHKEGSNWIFDHKVTSPGATNTGAFGSAGAMGADGVRCIIGAHNEGNAQGNAYIFVRSGNTWTAEATLSDPLTAASDFFGGSVAISSDGSRCAVGGQNMNNGATADTGGALVFKRTGTSWAIEQRIFGSDVATGDGFGATGIVMSADGTRLMVPSIYATVSGQAQAGAVYSFTFNGSTWVQEQKITSSSVQANARFGWSITFGGGTYAAISSPYQTVNGLTQAGRVEIYNRSGSVWSLETTISSPTPEATATFGLPVSMSSDGLLLLIGSGGASQNGIAGGAAFLYSKSSGSWILYGKARSSDMAAGDNFGGTLWLAKNGLSAAIGSTGSDVGGVSNVGAAYMFNIS